MNEEESKEKDSGSNCSNNDNGKLIVGTEEIDKRSKTLLEKVKQKIPGLRIAIPKDPVVEPLMCTPNLCFPLKAPSMTSPVPLSPYCTNLLLFQYYSNNIAIAMSAQMGCESRGLPCSSHAVSPGGMYSAFRQYDNIMSPISFYKPLESAKKS